jgi:hypothetical protein
MMKNLIWLFRQGGKPLFRTELKAGSDFAAKAWKG